MKTLHALDFAYATGASGIGFGFGIEKAALIAALRAYADQIEAGTIAHSAIQRVAIESEALADDFTLTTIRIVLAERVP